MKINQSYLFRARLLLSADGGGGTGTMEAKAFQKTMLDGLESIKEGQGEAKKKMSELDLAFKKVSDEKEIIRVELDDLKKLFNEARKQKLAGLGASIAARRPNHVSDETARFLGSVGIHGLFKQEKIESKAMEDRLAGIYKDITGVEIKTALSTSDIPMPTGYSGDIVELVYQYGQARQWGTVFPLPNGTFKLPKLTTDPTFGLTAVSSGGAEVSPQASFVTFTAEKFGGIIRLPTEIEEDSIIMLGQFIARYSARQMAYVEDWNFFRGTGAASGLNGTAEGLTKSVVTDTQFIYNGGGSTSGKTKPSDAVLADFRTLRATPSGAVLGQAAYYMHPTYEQLLCSFNTSSTVTPYIANGINGASLDGFPIRWTNTMPAYSTSATVSVVHVLFGDVTFNYLGVRGAMRYDTSKEAGFTTDELLIRALERFTIGKMATNAVAGLRCSAS